MRAVWAALVLAGALLVLVAAGRENPLARLAGVGSRKEKPYPYSVAYQFGFDYREASVKEDAWQVRFHGRHAATPGGVSLTQFYPRYPDTADGAAASWRERRAAMPFVYVDARSQAGREPTAEEKKLEQEGWVAGYLESVRRHPAAD
ncbi:MAG TPA: hypothetical protein VFE78_09190 [Gemmataceae bacterium]|jgi:hypothetical protein|nr:hypothetical protein [Gemmataceae bacterium]